MNRHRSQTCTKNSETLAYWSAGNRFSLSQIGKRALTFMPASVPNVLTNYSLVLGLIVGLWCTRVKSASRISRAMWVLRHRPYSKSFASSLISGGQLATLTSRCFAHAVRASKSMFLQQNEMCFKKQNKKQCYLFKPMKAGPASECNVDFCKVGKVRAGIIAKISSLLVQSSCASRLCMKSSYSGG